MPKNAVKRTFLQRLEVAVPDVGAPSWRRVVDRKSELGSRSVDSADPYFRR